MKEFIFRVYIAHTYLESEKGDMLRKKLKN